MESKTLNLLNHVLGASSDEMSNLLLFLLARQGRSGVLAASGFPLSHEDHGALILAISYEQRTLRECREMRLPRGIAAVQRRCLIASFPQLRGGAFTA